MLKGRIVEGEDESSSGEEESSSVQNKESTIKIDTHDSKNGAEESVAEEQKGANSPSTMPSAADAQTGEKKKKKVIVKKLVKKVKKVGAPSPVSAGSPSLPEPAKEKGPTTASGAGMRKITMDFYSDDDSSGDEENEEAHEETDDTTPGSRTATPQSGVTGPSGYTQSSVVSSTSDTYSNTEVVGQQKLQNQSASPTKTKVIENQLGRLTNVFKKGKEKITQNMERFELKVNNNTKKHVTSEADKEIAAVTSASVDDNNKDGQPNIDSTRSLHTPEPEKTLAGHQEAGQYDVPVSDVEKLKAEAAAEVDKEEAEAAVRQLYAKKLFFSQLDKKFHHVHEQQDQKQKHSLMQLQKESQIAATKEKDGGNLVRLREFNERFLVSKRAKAASAATASRTSSQPKTNSSKLLTLLDNLLLHFQLQTNIMRESNTARCLASAGRTQRDVSAAAADLSYVVNIGDALAEAILSS